MSRAAHISEPVIIAEGVDVAVYRLDEVRLIESWFANEEYVAYDAEGRELELVALSPERPGRRSASRCSEFVEVRATEGEPSHQRELADLLRRWLVAIGTDADVHQLELTDLVAIAKQRAEAY